MSCSRTSNMVSTKRRSPLRPTARPILEFCGTDYGGWPIVLGSLSPDSVVVDIGLGAGLSFGRATIGFIGPSGKKQFGVIGEPVNLAAFLGSEAGPGTSLVDCGSFRRAGGLAPQGRIIRLRSRKRHQRVETLRLYHGGAGLRG